MSILTGRGKERKSLSDVPIHLTGFRASAIIYKYTYTSMFVKGRLDGLCFRCLGRAPHSLRCWQRVRGLAVHPGHWFWSIYSFYQERPDVLITIDRVD
jgi:hypothetical protein